MTHTYDQAPDSQTPQPTAGTQLGPTQPVPLPIRGSDPDLTPPLRRHLSPPVAPPDSPLARLAPYDAGSTIFRMFKAGSGSYKKPKNHSMTLAAAQQAIQPLAHGEAGKKTGKPADSGVSVGQVGSYAFVQFLEKVGDGLTGDHQPSGAAVKELIRESLHSVLTGPLTRAMAKNAYKKAITIVMKDAWHKAKSRTYGGRNTPDQIKADAKDLALAAEKDWQETAIALEAEGFSTTEIEAIWDGLCEAREEFFATGDAQVGSL